MGSHRISFRKEMNPGLSDYQLAEKLSAIEPRDGGIIVRYKSSKNGSFDHFGSCGNIDMLKSYFSSSNCHDTEIIYIHPDVPLSLIPFGLKICKDVPNESKAYRLIQKKKQRKIEKEKQKAEELRVFQIQSDRQSSGCCIMCGKPIGFWRKLTRAKNHKSCTSFKEL